MARELLVDPAQIDMNNIIADAEEIRRHNPQRFEMEQLTAIVYEDLENLVCAGYKDVSDKEFWVRGHMPNMPLMPGVVSVISNSTISSLLRKPSFSAKGMKNTLATMAP